MSIRTAAKHSYHHSLTDTYAMYREQINYPSTCMMITYHPIDQEASVHRSTPFYPLQPKTNHLPTQKNKIKNTISKKKY